MHEPTPSRPESRARRGVRASTAALLASAAVLALPLPAAALTTVTPSARESVNYLYYFGGFAISGDEGEDGAPAPVPGGLWEGTVLTGFEQPTLAIAGSDHHDIAYLFWTGYLDETWDQSQTFRVEAGAADSVDLQISGHATISQVSEVCGPTGCTPASELHRSTNTLSLDFTLDASTPYTLNGSTSGGQYVDLLAWNELSARWVPLLGGSINLKNTSFALSGTLGPGLYRFGNSPYAFSGGAVDVANGFDATLNLGGAVLAVPEPAPAALLALGLVAGALWRRRMGAHARASRP